MAAEILPTAPAADPFGHWLSGFADGEAHFSLYLQHGKDRRQPAPTASFQLDLRADDAGVLEQVRAFLGCGGLHRQRRAARFIVRGVADLASKIVPHFDRYPLRSKKADDYRVWRRGVLLLSGRPGFRAGCGGPRVAYSDDDRATFAALVAELKALRLYQPAVQSGTTCQP